LLIQVQKGKVDLEGALMILEKIIRSNELSLGLLALLPLALVIYGIISFGKRKLFELWNRGNVKNRETFVKLLWKVDSLITKKSEDPLELGKLLVQLDEMLFIVQDSNMDAELREDVIALADPSISFEQRQWITNRIYRQLE
jgi:hypothetical protein